MLSNKTRTALMLALLLLGCAARTSAQDQTAASAPRDEPRADSAKQRSRIFELRYKQPEGIVRVLRPLGTPGSEWTWSNELKTITVRDFPENLASIEEAIQRLDRQEAAQQGIEFHVHILIASANQTSQKPLPPELSDVIKQLQSTLSYKNYSLMSSDVLRGRAGTSGVSNKGVSELRLSPDMAASTNPIFYEYRLLLIGVDNSSPGPAKVQVDNFSFSMKVPVAVTTGSLQYESIGFSTPVTVREGEKVVVGTTSMQDKALVIVITASVVK